MLRGKRPLNEAPSASTSAPRPTYDEKLRRVDHALENPTRTGETFASGLCVQFPLPGLSFRGAGELELLAPLRPDDVHKMKERGNVDQRNTDGTAAAWKTFLDDCLRRQHKTLGIAATSTVHIKLQKLLWVEAGGRLDCRDGQEERGDGVFGRLVVVMPGAFDGGSIVVQHTKKEDEDDEDEEGEMDDQDWNYRDLDTRDETSCVEIDKIVWRPGARKNPYELVYAVVFDNCEHVAEPVTAGAALCLVYELIVSDVSDVPSFAGPILEQRAVNTALTKFFCATLDVVAKRFKIGPDVWRTINEFATERYFVYQVGRSSFTDLGPNERQVAASLAAFCAQSGGQYTLFLTELVFSRDVGDSDDDTGYDSDEEVEPIVTLKSPWIKYGETVGEDYAPITLQNRFDVAPMGATDDCFEYPFIRRPFDASLQRMLKRIHGDIHHVYASRTFALVVQPSTIGMGQSVRYPVHVLVAKLRDLLTASRFENALQFARRIVHFNRPWHFEQDDMNGFADFVGILVELNDRQLFQDFLRVVDLECEDVTEVLQSAIQYFGWDDCLPAVEKGVRNSPTLSGRISLIRSMMAPSVTGNQFDGLIQALVSRPPWTEVPTVNINSLDSQRLRRDDLQELLEAAHSLCPQRLVDLVAIKHPRTMVLTVVPAVLRLLWDKRADDGPAHRAVVRRVWELFEPMLPDLKNEPYARIRIPAHCRECKELQAFLRSTETEAAIECASEEQREHLVKIIKRSNKEEAEIRYRRDPQTSLLRVDKSRANKAFGLHNDAVVWEQRLRERIEAITNI